MAKYNEIMEHIKVSDEMKSRVIKNIEEHFEEDTLISAYIDEPAATILRPAARKKRPGILGRKWITAIGGMVAAVILCICPLLIMKNQTQQEPANNYVETEPSGDNLPGSSINTRPAKNDHYYKVQRRKSRQDEQGIYEVGSVQELSEAVGFTVPEVNGIPFEVLNVRYYLYEDGSAEIVYVGEEKEILYFNMSKEIGDNIEDYLEQSYVRILSTLSFDVFIVEENEGKIFFAVWTDGEYTYSLDSEEGIGEGSVMSIVENLNKK